MASDFDLYVAEAMDAQALEADRWIDWAGNRDLIVRQAEAAYEALAYELQMAGA